MVFHVSLYPQQCVQMPILTSDPSLIYTFRIYEDLERCKLLQPMTGIVEGDDRHSSDTQHFVATTGVSSIVKHLFKKSGVHVMIFNVFTKFRLNL